MSSILTGNFKDNLARVYAEAESHVGSPAIARRGIPSGEMRFSDLFNELVKSLEHLAEGTTTEVNNGVEMSPSSGVTRAVLSNLTPSEGSRGTPVGVGSTTIFAARVNPSPPPEIVGGGVKGVTTAVNAPAHEPLLSPPRMRERDEALQQSGGPRSPHVPHARRTPEPLRSEESAQGAVAPLTPKVVSAKVKPGSGASAPADAPQPPVIRSARFLKHTEFGRALGLGNASVLKHDVREIIVAAGRHHGIDPRLGLAVASAESGLRSHAVSNDGHRSKGIFQLLDSTGLEMLDRFGFEDRYDPFDPALNSYLGVGYLRHLHDLFSTETVLAGSLKTNPAKSSDHLEKLAVAAFNSGQGAVARAQEKARRFGRDPSNYDHVSGFLPDSTRRYVARVTQLKKAFSDIV